MSDNTTYDAVKFILRLWKSDLTEEDVDDLTGMEILKSRIEKRMTSPSDFGNDDRTTRYFDEIRNLMKHFGISPVSAPPSASKHWLYSSWVVPKWGCEVGTGGGCTGRHCNGEGRGCGKCGHSFNDEKHECNLVFASKPDNFLDETWETYKANTVSQRERISSRLTNTD